MIWETIDKNIKEIIEEADWDMEEKESIIKTEGEKSAKGLIWRFSFSEKRSPQGE